MKCKAFSPFRLTALRRGQKLATLLQKQKVGNTAINLLTLVDRLELNQVKVVTSQTLS